MHNVEASIMTLAVSDHANTAHITTTSNHSNNAGIEANEVRDLARSNINLDRVVDLDGRIGKPNSTLPHQYFFRRDLHINQSLVQRLNDA